ncbi:MAG: DUF4302 domain-containing protein [Bacteroides sp.]|nr:DUF4302 domain-containing protein [Bacteroides sp.]
MMKKFFSIYTLLALLTLGACTSEVDDVFDKSASQRIEDAIANDLSVLRGASNGWVMEYYPSSTLTYGGYTMLVRFGTDGEAQVACDLFSKDLVATSVYEVKQSMGPMLTFDSYNEIFHFFSEPANELGIGDRGYGMEGDYEFLIMECSEEQVVLRGQKTGNKIVMKPVPTGLTWTEYLGSVKSVTSEAYPAAYDVLVNDVLQYSVVQKYRKFILVNSDGSQLALPFVYTTTGIKFYEPLSVGTQTIQTMEWDASQMAYVSGNVVIKAQELPTGYHRYEEFVGDYVFVYGNGNSMTSVALREELFNESFIMEGFPLDIRVLYKADTGMIGLESQQLSDNIYLCAWSLADGGYLTAGEGVGMEGSMYEEDGSYVVYFGDNGVWGRDTDSFIAYDYSSGGSAFQIPYVIGMVKIVNE